MPATFHDPDNPDRVMYMASDRDNTIHVRIGYESRSHDARPEVEHHLTQEQALVAAAKLVHSTLFLQFFYSGRPVPDDDPLADTDGLVALFREGLEVLRAHGGRVVAL